MNKIDYGILIKQLNEAANAYYNSDTPIMSDQEYDYKMEQLREFEDTTGIKFANSPSQVVGAPVLTELKKVAITPKPMLSLDKCHTEKEVAAFAGDKEMIAMMKLDGLSVRIKYNHGKLISANTRGNGVEGTDITEHIKQFLNVPRSIDYQGEYIIDGEAIIKTEDFNLINKNDEFKNPRNTAVGALNLLDTNLIKQRRLSFVAWDVIKGSTFETLSQRLAEAQNTYNFEVVQFILDIPIDEINSVNNILMSFSNEYPCDGVVWKYNDIEYGNSLGSTSHHFKSGIAWKPEVEVAESKLLYIQWQSGRGEELTPVAIFEPVELEGSTVSKASLHNYSIMRNVLGPCAYVGEPIKIIKSNMIIPQIIEAGPLMNYGKVIAAGGVSANDEPEFCPICNRPLGRKTSESGVINLCCDNPLCQGKLLNRINHYCSKAHGLDIKGLSEVTLQKLIDLEWIHNIEDLYQLSEYRSEWIQKPGFGEKSVDKILAAIEESKNTTLDRFISAIGIPLIGTNVAKDICKYVKTYEEFRQLVDEDFDFSKWDSFGYEKNSSIKEFDYTEADELAKLMNFVYAEENQQQKNNRLDGIIVVITGSLKTYKNRTTLQKVIEEKGGKVVGSVSSKTTYLINNDLESNSSKNLTAKKLGIPIISEEEFINKFLL